MSKKTWQEGVVLLELPSEPETSGELNSVIRYVHGQDDCDIAIGFSSVAIQTARSLASLLDPRDTLGSCGRRSLLSRVDQVTRGILSVTALDSVSEIVSDRLDVLATVQALPSSPTAVQNERAD